MWNAWYVHRLAHPLHPPTTINNASARLCLSWWFSTAKWIPVEELALISADMAGCGLTKPLWWQPFQAPSPLRSFLRYHFCSLHCWPCLETFPLCQVALRNLVACLKYSCNASLGEEMNSSILLRKCRIGPAEGQKLIHLVEVGNVCQEPRIRYPKES